MKFEEAMKYLRLGKLIKRPCFMFHLDKYTKTTMQLMINDIFQDDWIILEEPGKSFPEVFEAFQQGRRIRRKSWSEYSYTDKNGFANGMDKNHIPDIQDLLATDWEIIE